jgi:hypothetical protein
MVWKWKGVMVSILTSLIIVLRVMMTMGYCIIPNRRGLVQRLIKTILTKETPVSYQNNLLLLDTTECESSVNASRI